MKAHYDDPNFFYESYWTDRNYEHESEVIALETLLSQQHYQSLADIGGGFGRMIPTLSQYADQVFLVEPSQKQRTIASKLFSGKQNIHILTGTSEKTRLPSSSQDVLCLIRVSHHLPDIKPTLTEAFRVLKPRGVLILEFANSANFKAKIASLVSGKSIPLSPLDLRSARSIRAKTIPFVNHHPVTLRKYLKDARFEIKKTLSVSNFRSPLLKKIIPLKILLVLESAFQSALSSLWFGPSIFVYAQKLDST